MTSERDAVLARRCAYQHGVFTAAQAADVGFDARARTRRVEAGHWERVHRGVFQLVGVAPSTESRLIAACFAGGHLACASRRSAAYLFGLPGGSDGVVEIMCGRWRRARHDGLVVHEWCADLGPADVTVRRAIPVTSVDVTLLTLGSVASEAVVEQALDAAVHRSLTTMGSARATMERLAKRGRDGCATLRSILDRRAPVVGTPESPAETRLLRMLHRHGLPAPVLQFEIRDGATLIARVDAAYPDQRIAIEYDSYTHHTGRQALVRDSARRNQLTRLGWSLIAVTAEDLRMGGGAVAVTIRELLRRAS